MSLSNGTIRFITRISKFSCCLYSAKIVYIRSDSVLKSRLFSTRCLHFSRCNTLDKRLLFEISVAVPYISFHSNQNGKVIAAYLGNEMSLFDTSRALFRSDVSFILQLIWEDAIFVSGCSKF